MVVWSGRGYIVGLTIFLSFIISSFAVESFLGYNLKDKDPFQSDVMLMIGCYLATFLSFLIYKFYISKSSTHKIIHPETKSIIEIPRSDSLFFIPLKYVPYVIMLFAIYLTYTVINV